MEQEAPVLQPSRLAKQIIEEAEKQQHDVYRRIADAVEAVALKTLKHAGDGALLFSRLQEELKKRPAEVANSLVNEIKKVVPSNLVKELAGKFNANENDVLVAMGAGVLQELVRAERIVKGTRGVGKFLHEVIEKSRTSGIKIDVFGAAHFSRSLLSEIKAAVGVRNDLAFIEKYARDAGFHRKVNEILKAKLTDPRYSIFNGMSPEEIVKGITNVDFAMKTRVEKLREELAFIGPKAVKGSLLLGGTAAITIVNYMISSVTSAIFSQVPGGTPLSQLPALASRSLSNLASELSSMIRGKRTPAEVQVPEDLAGA
ncbi:MAG: hypothetical protein QXM08_03650 [Thermofilaceae archaeon]